MRSYLWQKIDEVRREPEHVRMRYVFLCLAVSMIFIVGIWILSLQESFSTVKKDLPEAVEGGKPQFPENSAPSLNDLLEQAAPLRVNSEQETSGQEFFQGQVQEKNTTAGSSDSSLPE